MTTIAPNKAAAFILVFSVIALVINSATYRVRQPPPAFVPSIAQQQQQAQQQQLAIDNAAAAKKAADDAAAARANYLARYLNPGFARTPGFKTLAVVVASENAKLNHAVGVALANHFKNGNVETVSSFFTPEFVSDGLFAEAVNDPTRLFSKLELARSLDAVVLARQTVSYTKTPALDNVISATMQLEVVLTPVAAQGQSQSWTFTAYGSGFSTTAARAMAEERLIKQISNDTKMSLGF
jgi:hypothetical protein